ncbi:glycosyltransferase [Myroides injenensis]|uniref:glycosyltransferase n=1 Tax=Myroides injenensis TaxID=1183151 RepID=UPI002271B7D2|nr:glycosyltransferase [Myroides injenensis]
MLDNIKNKMECSSSPLVSISCITFNHGKFIRETLDGFLSQKTSFGFEILIHDDASTDDTVTIIKEYAERFPNIIKPIFQKENQYSKGVRGINRRFNFPRAQGKYIAMCEGDDYWIDEYKLQKQVDIFNKNDDISIMHTGYVVRNETKDKEEIHIKKIRNPSRSENYNYLYTGDARTLTCMFRKDKLDLILGVLEKKELEKNPIGDRALFLLLSSVGRMDYLPDVTGVYRLFNSESATRFSDPKKKYEFGIKCFEVELFLLKQVRLKDYRFFLQRRIMLFRCKMIFRLLRFNTCVKMYKYFYNMKNKEYSNTGFY